MANVKDFEGSVPVDGNITPITRQKIEQVDSSAWPELSTNQLFEQKSIMGQRLSAAEMAGASPMIIAQIQRGINYIDSIINSRNSDANSVF